MEALTGPEAGKLTAQEVVEQSGLPISTGYRILGELQELGLAHRTADRKMLANFSFERRLSPPQLDPELIAKACAYISETLTTASEIVVPSGQNIVWHMVHQHPDQAIRLRAFPGFVRAAYELDSLSRLALAHLPSDELKKNWDTNAFHTTGVDRRPVEWLQAQDMIQAVDLADLQFDMMGNAKGVRRFCVAINGCDGKLACLLTVAEAAIPVKDEAEHTANIRDLLLSQKAIIEQSNLSSK